MPRFTVRTVGELEDALLYAFRDVPIRTADDKPVVVEVLYENGVPYEVIITDSEAEVD